MEALIRKIELATVSRTTAWLSRSMHVGERWKYLVRFRLHQLALCGYRGASTRQKRMFSFSLHPVLRRMANPELRTCGQCNKDIRAFKIKTDMFVALSRSSRDATADLRGRA